MRTRPVIFVVLAIGAILAMPAWAGDGEIFGWGCVMGTAIGGGPEASCSVHCSDVLCHCITRGSGASCLAAPQRPSPTPRTGAGVAVGGLSQVGTVAAPALSLSAETESRLESLDPGLHDLLSALLEPRPVAGTFIGKATSVQAVDRGSLVYSYRGEVVEVGPGEFALAMDLIGHPVWTSAQGRFDTLANRFTMTVLGSEGRRLEFAQP